MHVIQLLEGENLSVQLATGGYQFDSLDELIERRGVSPKFIRLAAVNPKSGWDSPVLTVDFHPRIFALYSHDPAVEQLGHEITRYLSNLRFRVPAIFRVGTNWLTGFFFLAVIFAIRPLHAALQLPVLFSMGAWSMAMMGYTFWAPSIVLRPFHQGFWARNSDKLWLMVIGGIMGAAITQLGNVVAHLTPKASDKPVANESKE